MSFIKVDDVVELKQNFNRIPKGSKVQITKIFFTDDNNLYVTGNGPGHIAVNFPVHVFKMDDLDFLGSKVKYEQRVKFQIKSVPDLLKEGWKREDDGTLTKDDAYYKFTKKKIQMCGRMLSGSIKVNPKFNICIVENDTYWNFDESMVKYILIEDDYFEVAEDISGIGFHGRVDGRIIINGEYSIHKKDVPKLIKFLLKHQKWEL